MATILCFGDSNTWGISPTGNRYKETERWTTLLANHLVDKSAGQHTIVEAGQPNRTVVHNAPFSGDVVDSQIQGKSGIRYLKPYLSEYQPDVVLIMLGTNDLKKRYGLTAKEIEQGMHRLVKQTLNFDYADESSAAKVLIICPPPIYEVGAYVKMYAGAAKKSEELAKHYLQIANALDCYFFDAGLIIQSCSKEGIHWQVNQHRLLADALAKQITNILKG